MKSKVRTLAVVLFLLLAGGLAIAQDSQATKLLDLKEAQLTLDNQKEELKRALRLREENLISEEDFSRTRTIYLKAQVHFQQALIGFLGSEMRVSVVSAVKRQAPDGARSVQVSLSYSSRNVDELAKLGMDTQDLFPLQYLREIRDVYVSLRSEGRIISDPYERCLSSLPVGEVRQVTFAVLKDVDTLDVSVSYAGKTDTTGVYLQKDASANLVTVSSAQFSQEADLDGQAVYDLSLEKFSGEADVFKLEVVNLPRQIGHEFFSPETQARLSQIKFGKGITSMKLALRLLLPKDAGAEIVVDDPIEFYVLAIDNAQAEKCRGMLEGAGPSVAARIEQSRLGWARFELIPRGTGRVEIRASNLYREIEVGAPLRMEVRLKNTGTRALSNVRVSSDAPLNWRSEIQPSLVSELDQGDEATVVVILAPPKDAPVGDYEAKIKAESFSGSRKAPSEDATIRIHLRARANVIGIAFLAVLLVGLLTAVVVFGVRLSKR